jgi:hypothetical protein
MTTFSDNPARDRRETNGLILRDVLLPTIFLTVVLLGGLRIEGGTHALVFVGPPLITLILAVMLMSIFVRGRLIDLGAWYSGTQPAVETVAHALTLVSMFFASAQAFNSVLPEAGLFRLLFSFFFLWTLWQSQFAPSDARRTLRSVAALFGTAFALKHLLLASLNDAQGGWLRRLAAALLEGVTQGTVGEQQAFAPATGYVSFFALALYVAGLALMPAVPDRRVIELIGDDRPRLLDGERAPLLREDLRQVEGREIKE